MDITKRAIELASPNHDNTLRIINIGSSDKYNVIIMATDDLLKIGDGLEFPTYLYNKNTGKEALCYGYGVFQEPGFEDLNFNDIDFKYLES